MNIDIHTHSFCFFILFFQWVDLLGLTSIIFSVWGLAIFYTRIRLVSSNFISFHLSDIYFFYEWIEALSFMYFIASIYLLIYLYDVTALLVGVLIGNHVFGSISWLLYNCRQNSFWLFNQSSWRFSYVLMWTWMFTYDFYPKFICLEFIIHYKKFIRGIEYLFLLIHHVIKASYVDMDVYLWYSYQVYFCLEFIIHYKKK